MNPLNTETVRFDFNNMMEDTLGRGRGLRVGDINGLKKKAKEIHNRIQEMRQAGTTPFYDVIFHEPGLEPILAMAQKIRERFENLVVLGIGGSALGAGALHQALGHDRYKGHFLLTTDVEVGPLRQVAREEGFLSLSLAGGVVGRHSVFSPVGLLPKERQEVSAWQGRKKKRFVL